MSDISGQRLQNTTQDVRRQISDVRNSTRRDQKTADHMSALQQEGLRIIYHCSKHCSPSRRLYEPEDPTSLTFIGQIRVIRNR